MQVYNFGHKVINFESTDIIWILERLDDLKEFLWTIYLLEEWN